jgi:hypothetical protein
MPSGGFQPRPLQPNAARLNSARPLQCRLTGFNAARSNATHLNTARRVLMLPDGF